MNIARTRIRFGTYRFKANSDYGRSTLAAGGGFRQGQNPQDQALLSPGGDLFPGSAVCSPSGPQHSALL
jgi:hypothetical protein